MSSSVTTPDDAGAGDVAGVPPTKREPASLDPPLTTVDPYPLLGDPEPLVDLVDVDEHRVFSKDAELLLDRLLAAP